MGFSSERMDSISSWAIPNIGFFLELGVRRNARIRAFGTNYFAEKSDHFRPIYTEKAVLTALKNHNGTKRKIYCTALTRASCTSEHLVI